MLLRHASPQQGACCSPRAIHNNNYYVRYLATVSPLCVSVTFSCLFVVLSSISMSLDVYLSISHLFFTTGRRLDGLWQGLLAVERHSRSLRQRARAPHAYFAAPVRGRTGPCSTLRGCTRGARQGPDRRLRTAVQQRRPGRVPRFIGAYLHRQYTVPLCLGARGPGIAELRSVACRVAS